MIFGSIMQKKAYKRLFYAEIRHNKIKILLIKRVLALTETAR